MSPARRVPPLRLVVAKTSAPQNPQRGRYHYPKTLLKQAYFCRNGNGEWHEPTLSLSMVSSPKFESPLGALLDQLAQEGHDVSGARIEWTAYREQVSKLCDDFDKSSMQIMSTLDRVSKAHPVLAHAMYCGGSSGGTS